MRAAPRSVGRLVASGPSTSLSPMCRNAHMRPAATTARVHFPNGRTRIVVLEEPPAYGRQLVGPLPYGPWVCEGVKRRARSASELETEIQYEVWPRRDG